MSETIVEELTYKDVSNMVEKAKNLVAQQLSKYFNFEISTNDIIINTIFVMPEYATIEASWKYIAPVSVTVYSDRVVLRIKQFLEFEEKTEANQK